MRRPRSPLDVWDSTRRRRKPNSTATPPIGRNSDITMLLLVTVLLLALSGVEGFDQSVAPNRILNPTNTNPDPNDMRGRSISDVNGANWRVFAVNSAPDRAVVITQVEEVRQQNPPSTWGVYVGNADIAPVVSLTVAAAVVDAHGKVRATQN